MDVTSKTLYERERWNHRQGPGNRSCSVNDLAHSTLTVSCVHFRNALVISDKICTIEVHLRQSISDLQNTDVIMVV